MNIGIILPARRKQESRLIQKICRAMGSLVFATVQIETRKIELFEGLTFVVCSIPVLDGEIPANEGAGKKIKPKLARIFEEENTLMVLEHPSLKGFFNSRHYSFEDILREVAVNRFTEVLKLIRGIGNLSSREITVTGRPDHLEYAIARLITRAGSVNILLPEGSENPHEAEQAFAETGIPVHLTTDPEVLDRTALWIRFPDDYAGFDALPQNFKGIIVDFGAMQIIDTKSKKIFNIFIEFSEKIRRKIGHSILHGCESGALEGLVLSLCANAWDIGVTEASVRLDMRPSYKS